MVKVGQIRHIQACYEDTDARNPDTLVYHFLTARERLGCALRGWMALNRLRANPFYHYVLARTRHYDNLFVDAITSGVRFIVNVGSGSDTRAHRWREQLVQREIAVLECDRGSAIQEKSRLAKRALEAGHVQYLAIDLDRDAWPELEEWLARHFTSRGYVMLEGVSPYIQRNSFIAFLRLLSTRLAADSQVAYDYKLIETDEGFGPRRVEAEDFRLTADASEAAGFHARLGLLQEFHELSSALIERTLPRVALCGYPVFCEDALVRLRVRAATT
jgi:methyltransferase (TIGR00027 family)